MLDINVTNPVVVNTREKFHIYPLSGVSAYRFDYDEDGIEDFVLENRHLISVYDGRVNTDRSLLILRQKDTQANYQFGDISDSDVIGRGEVTTSNLKRIKFHSFDFSDSGENKTSVHLNMVTEVSDPTEELITFYDTTNGASNDARVFVDDDQWLAQRFNQTDLDEDFTLSRVSVFVDSGPRASNPLVVEIRTDTGGLPSSTVLASESIPAASVPTTADWVDATFVTPAQLLQGGLYWLVLRNIDSRSGRGPNVRFAYTWTADTTSPAYPGPFSFSLTQGASWTIDPTADLFFRAFGFPSAITTIFDFAITMNSENADYLVYRLFNFDEFIDDINNIFIPLSGSLGPSTGDDRYHIGDGTDDAVSTLSSNTWTNFSALTDQEKYVAIYDDSNSFDDVNDNVLSLVFFPNTNTLPAQDVGAWFETDRDALRFRYDTLGATTSDEAEYILVFSQGDFSIIDQWMSTIAGGTLPSPNFRTVPSALSLFVSPNTLSIGSVSELQINQSSLFTVTNNGDVTETFTLNIDGPSSPSLWLAGSTAGLDVYVIKGLFGPTAGDPTGLFSSEDVILIGSPSLATSTQFGDASLSPNGVSVEVSGERGLWLEFQAPSATGVGGSQQSFTVTVGAQEP
ncbi:MAG: hypothetical protein IID32_11850 [Planctomycetes bacterium]|nr:hypothetical protein [Planctomycetota bacterium]